MVMNSYMSNMKIWKCSSIASIILSSTHTSDPGMTAVVRVLSQFADSWWINSKLSHP